MVCALFGHRDAPEAIKEALRRVRIIRSTLEKGEASLLSFSLFGF